MLHSFGKKLLNSGTATQWLFFLVRPLRLLLLTPLVLTMWNEQDITAFYLILAVTGFSALITEFLPGIMNPVLVFFYSGVQNLSEVGQRVEESRSPNWEGFSDALLTLRRTQIWIAFLFVSITCGMTVQSLSSHFGWVVFKEEFSLIPVLIGLQVIVQVFSAGLAGALKAVRQVAVVNKNGALFALLQVASSSLVLAFGGSLELILFSQLCVGVVGRGALFRIYRKRIPQVSGGVFRIKILKHILKPAGKRLVGMLSVKGVRTLSPALLAGILESHYLILYSLTLAVSAAATSASSAFVFSQLPRMGSHYARGEVEELRTLVFERVAYSMLMFTSLIVTAVLLGFLFTNFKETKVGVVTPGFALEAGLLFLFLFVVNILSACYNVTNERPFYLRNLASGVVTIVCLQLCNHFHVGRLELVLLAVTLPQLLLVIPLLMRKMGSFLKLDSLSEVKSFLRVGMTGLLEGLRGLSLKSLL